LPFSQQLFLELGGGRPVGLVHFGVQLVLPRGVGLENPQELIFIRELTLSSLRRSPENWEFSRFSPDPSED